LGRGLDNAGKTTIVKRIMNEDVNSVSPTLGFIIKTVDFEGYKLNIWDVGGQKTIRSYWRNYFEKTDSLIWVVDATDRMRINDCKDELRGLLLEEVSSKMMMEERNLTDAAPCGVKCARFLEQDRHSRLYGGGRGYRRFGAGSDSYSSLAGDSV
jgi:ADP-ribosylation factor-like protein 2